MKRRLVLAGLTVTLALVSAIFLLRASASGTRQATAVSAPSAPAMTFTVSTTADNGAGSLRDAIAQANASPGADVINFDIGINTPTIMLGSSGFGPLQAITGPVTINGATGGATRIELDGSLTGAAANGLTITAGNCTIRGLVINRFSGNGAVISGGGGNVLENNFIGTDATGTIMLNNTLSGVLIDGSPNNTIGGTTAATRNLISGNDGTGVQIQNAGGSNNTVEGNFIGTDVTGTLPLRNASGGVLVLPGASEIVIGGTVAGSGNLISGNGGFGVHVEGDSHMIVGNLIGTRANGLNPLPNSNGVELSNVSVCLVGGTNGRNIISGNDATGVLITNNSSANQIQGNFIGTDINGTMALGNASNGVVIELSSSNNTIGGTNAGDGNVISANASAGVFIGGASGNFVQGNLIGTDVSGVANLGNMSSGIFVGSSTLNNAIGGVAAGAGNTIAFNGSAGITMVAGAQNPVLSNSIFSNTSVGIDLSDDNGITPNDPCDGDTGANNLQNFPVLTSATSGGNTAIQGSLDSTASTQFRIEFFSNPVCDGSGNGEGKVFIGSAVVTTDAACIAPFNVNLAVTVPAGQAITATATDLQGNSSEFSACAVIPAAPCTINCPANVTRSNDPGLCGAVAAYPAPTTAGACGTVTCNPASGSFFPTGLTNVTCATTAGPSCMFSVTVNDTQLPTITCPANVTTPATSPAGANVDFPPPIINDNCPGVTAACAPPTGSTFPVGMTTVTCTATDASTNQANCGFTVTVTAQADLSITKNGSPNPVGSGSNLTYTIAVNNAGPSGATGVTVTDNVPAGTTFVSVTPSQGTFTAPPSGGTGLVTCTLGPIAFGGSASITLVVHVTAAPGSVINNTALVASTSNDPGAGNNSASAMTPVILAACTINCPADVSANTLPLPFGCGALVSYPAPTTVGPCGGFSCVPPSNSFFAVGVTSVTCAAEAGSSCSFNVTVHDTTAPRITCAGNISTSAPPGKNSVVVNYSPPVVVDNCSGGTATCTPQSGALFPLGTSVVTCTAGDNAGNSSTCTFSVTVSDSQAPTIACPSPVAVDIPAGQCAAIVSYPPPAVTDNTPGTVATCAPPSGSAFPVGVTTVTCAAVDISGNRATCAFAVTVRGPAGPVQTTTVIFGGQTPVAPVRKAKKNPPASCDCSKTFTIPNNGCGVLGLDFLSISRTGSDVTSGKISNPDDSKFFSVRVINPDGSERLTFPAICAGFCVEIAPGQSQTFRVVFSPVIPRPSGKTTGLAASEVLPDTVTSKITFSTNSGGTLTIDLIAHVGTALQLINANKPKKEATASFTKSGDEFTLTYSVFDSNLDTTRAKYELLNQSGTVVGEAIEVDLIQPIVDGHVSRGQSFIVEQKFPGASNRPEVTGVRLTVFDAESSDSLTTQLGSSANQTGVAANGFAKPVSLKPRAVRLEGSRP